jgi:CheY-like chemotaxis protein
MSPTKSDLLPLTGYRVLVVEDEMLIAMMMCDVVAELGGAFCTIAPSLERAFAALEDEEIGCAILDVNLAGSLSYPVAAALRRRNIPFLYCTAYADAASVFAPVAAAPRLDKPVQKEELRQTLVQVLKATEQQ